MLDTEIPTFTAALLHTDKGTVARDPNIRYIDSVLGSRDLVNDDTTNVFNALNGKRPRNTIAYQNEHGDELCRCIHGLVNYWFQFGFFDMNMDSVNDRLINTVLRNVTISPIVRYGGEDDAHYEDDGYA
jgi:hypothetical protein